MDEQEFVHRIEIYIDTDLPELGDRRRIAEALGGRLYQYVRPPVSNEAETSSTLEGLLPPDALLFFGAPWDGHTQGYRPTVAEAARLLNLRVIEIDVDDPVGSAIARVFSVLNTPAVVRAGPPA